MIIRLEQQSDISDIRELNEKVFGQPQEANIVDNLRVNCDEILSIVAIENEKVVGHILFIPVTIEDNNDAVKGMGLAPIAVLPEFQRKGIGSRLVNWGIEELRKTAYTFIIVLGHPDYYPRFGFESASRYGIKSQWEGIPDNAFMILWLNKSKMIQIWGKAKYRSEFNEAI
jgi:putative acetyltransferase